MYCADAKSRSLSGAFPLVLSGGCRSIFRDADFDWPIVNYHFMLRDRDGGAQ